MPSLRIGDVTELILAPSVTKVAGDTVDASLVLFHNLRPYGIDEHDITNRPVPKTSLFKTGDIVLATNAKEIRMTYLWEASNPLAPGGNTIGLRIKPTYHPLLVYLTLAGRPEELENCMSRGMLQRLEQSKILEIAIPPMLPEQRLRQLERQFQEFHRLFKMHDSNLEQLSKVFRLTAHHCTS